MSFFKRNRAQLEERGIDPARLPPGQYFTDRFPVLHVGDVPRYAPDLSDWDLRIFGEVATPYRLTFAGLTDMETIDTTIDIHCVTKWSKFDTRWRGVRVRDLLERAGVAADASHIVAHGEFGYTANLPLADAVGDNALVTWAFEDEALEPQHGYPARLFIPHLYFWKSVKWLRGIEVTNENRPGFWERNGYHDYGDPFLEQRYS